ncbi:hypothetical protein Esti_001393 [Eimeria stiedai]
MPLSQKFWELLLGEDVAAALAPQGKIEGRAERKARLSVKSPRDEADQTAGTEQPTSSSPRQLSISTLDIEDFLRMTGDELCRQPAQLHTEIEKIAAAQDELAVQNCSLFLTSSKALDSFRCSIENLSATLAELQQCVKPLHTGLKQFKAESNAATSREASLHILSSMQRSVSELLDLPSIALNCCKGGLYNEAVDVLMFADEKMSTLRASGCNNLRLLESLTSELEDVHKTCRSAMLRQLGKKAQLSDSIQLVGPLRRLSCSEGQLSRQFLERRNGDIGCQRHNAEIACEAEPAQGLCAAAELLRSDVLQTAIHYRTIFGTIDGPLSAWLVEQVYWFVKLVELRLLHGTAHGALEVLDGESSALAHATESTATPAGSERLSEFPVKLADLANVFRHAYSAAWALHRVQCFFFPSVAMIFERYVIAMHKHTLDKVATAFEQSLDEYDYRPSLAYVSLLKNTPWFETCIAANPCCLFLLRHAPLSNLYNSIAEALNSFQECFISTAAPGILSVMEKLFIKCIRKLSSVKPGERQELEGEIQGVEHHLLERNDYEGTTTQQVEFFVMCDIFASALLPTVSDHLSATFPSRASCLPESLYALLEEAQLSARSSPFSEACTALRRTASPAIQEALEPSAHMTPEVLKTLKKPL